MRRSEYTAVWTSSDKTSQISTVTLEVLLRLRHIPSAPASLVASTLVHTTMLMVWVLRSAPLAELWCTTHLRMEAVDLATSRAGYSDVEARTQW